MATPASGVNTGSRVSTPAQVGAAAAAVRPGRATRAEAVVDLDAIADNTAALKEHVGGRDLMAVVKADGYGHGIVEAARTCRDGGADWLGVALLEEALQLRAAGDTGPVLCWLAVPGERYDLALTADIEVSAYSVPQLDEICEASRATGVRARLQLKIDTGLSRGGAWPTDWPDLLAAAKAAQDEGRVEVTGVWSHLACSDEPDHPSVAAQLAVFESGVRDAFSAGLEPRHLHLANSGGVLALPDTWFTLVRPGVALYGVSPFADGNSPVPLRPAMRLRAELALVKRVPAGSGVSYGHTYTTTAETTLALVPLGYADGVPRAASNRAPVGIGGSRFTVSGRVCMDQFVVDIGDQGAQAGDEVVLFGDVRRGEPTAHDWAVACDTIGYEIVTRIGGRVPRRYVTSRSAGGDR